VEGIRGGVVIKRPNSLSWERRGLLRNVKESAVVSLEAGPLEVGTHGPVIRKRQI
jgi:hypothetical protein